MNNRRKIAETIFMHALQAVDPAVLVRNSMWLEEKKLHVATESINLEEIGQIYVVGVGKAAAPMAQAVESILGNRISGGTVITKYGHGLLLQYISVMEAAHPVPDANGLLGSQRIQEVLSHTTDQDLVLVLLSGGGSALLADVPPDCTLAEVQLCFEALLRSGAAIEEVNTVRKHMSAIKGGQLARLAAPARVITLMLSDVIGDKPEVIASGPTVADPTTFADAWKIILKYNLTETIPVSLVAHLQSGMAGLIPETAKPGDPAFQRETHHLIGSNRRALEFARSAAEALGYTTEILTESLSGEAREMGLWLVERAQAVLTDAQKKKPYCLLVGGETTVTIQGNGLGGRNQELALAAAIALERQPGITLLAAGTDGTDGPTPAAGAIVDAQTLFQARVLGIEAVDYLKNNNSYSFFDYVGGHLIIGATQTNVMDLVIVLVV